MKQQGNRKFWKKKARDLHSYWRRQEEAQEQRLYPYAKCRTCETRKHWKYMHVGHYMPRTHESTYFDRENNHVQCPICNWQDGEQAKHREVIEQLHGEGTAEALKIKSKQQCKRDWYDYYYIAWEFWQKLNDAGLELPPGTKTLFK